ncbi:MAG: glycosyltransferase [Bradyrhizobium sp.]|nr:glycosyltransferase [Bradyrhizobium sp.]
MLRQAMLSVAGQIYRHIEHLIVEDGGNEAEAVVRGFGNPGYPVHYLPQAKIGRSRAGNCGLEAAAGELVVFLDDDDLLFADHIETLVAALAADPGAVAAYSLAWDVPTTMRDRAAGQCEEGEFIHHDFMAREVDFAALLVQNYFPMQSVLFRRDLFLTRGGLDPTLDALENWDLWLRYVRGNRFAYVPKTTSLYRTPAGAAAAAKRTHILDKAYHRVRDAALTAASGDPPSLG